MSRHPALPLIHLRFDMRAPTLGASRRALYEAALDMAEYADEHGFDDVMLSEHHGEDDGYLPAPIIMGAAIAARTRQLRIKLQMPASFYEPLRMAEDLALLDIISGGRLIVVLLGGYVPAEFAMFDKAMKNRPVAMQRLVETLKQAWTGEAFEYEGRQVRITPRPLQQPRPPIHLGGSVPAAARRAAEIADGFLTHLPELYELFLDAAKALGKTPDPFTTVGPTFFHITRDPEAAWQAIAPHAMHEMNAYAKYVAASGTENNYKPVTSLDEIRASGGYAVVTPEQCVDLARSVENVLLHPLMGGMDPALGWESLKLFTEEVLPVLRP